MKKHLYLMPILALSLGGFVLAGCDNKKDDNATADQTTTTTEAAAPIAMESTAPVAQATVDVTNAYAFATTAGATTGAVFATLHNPQTNADMLTAAKADDVAGSVEIHENYQDPQTGTVEMRKTSGVDLAAGADVKLEPTGSHIMLLDLKKPLVQGDTFNITLTFRNAGDVTVPVTVNAAGDTMSGMSHDSMAAPATDATTTTTTTTTTPADSSATAPSESGDEEGAAPATTTTTTTTTPDASSTTTTAPATSAPADDKAAE